MRAGVQLTCFVIFSRVLRSLLPLPAVLCTSLLLHTTAIAQNLEALNRELPKWIQFNGEYRARFEGFTHRAYSKGNDDHYLLNRVRFGFRVKPADRVQLVVQTQDSRVFGNSLIPSAPPFQDSFDLRLGYLELGDPEKTTLAFRVGRQEISLGEERLLGSSNWGNTARSFDALRVYWRPVPKARFDLFASSVVAQTDGSFDRHVDGDDLHGVIGQLDWRGVHFEPFGLWRLAPRARSESGQFGKLDTKTFGTRVVGRQGKQTEYVMEMIGQTGSWGLDAVGSWAGHWRVVRTLSTDRRVPRLRFEYDYATGDSDPADGRHQTFELLYPTPHDKLGLADQVGWKNIHHLGGVGEWLPNRSLTLQVKFHEWWLASLRDGVYNAGGVLISRDPSGQSGRHVGHEVDLQALGNVGKQLKLGGGVGHVFPGGFLRRTTPGRAYTFPYVMLTWAF